MRVNQIILTVAVTVLVAAVAWPEAVVESYASKEYGVYFDVPAGWTLDRKPPTGLLVLKDTLGLLDVTMTAEIMPKKKDVREYADRVEKGRGLSAYRKDVAAMVREGAEGDKIVGTLKGFLYDDIDATARARKKYEEAMAKRAETSLEDPGSIPDEREFLAGITTRLYENEALEKTQLVYFVIGGGVGYTVTVSAARADFFTVLPLSQDLIKAMRLDKLTGGRYALPDVKTVAGAKMGIIMGKVLANGKSIAGVPVNLYTSAEAQAKGVPSFSSRTNGYGEYVFTHLNPGRYFLLEVTGVSDEGARFRSFQPIKNIDVGDGRVTFINVEVTPN